MALRGDLRRPQNPLRLLWKVAAIDGKHTLLFRMDAHIIATITTPRKDMFFTVKSDADNSRQIGLAYAGVSSEASWQRRKPDMHGFGETAPTSRNSCHLLLCNYIIMRSQPAYSPKSVIANF